MRLGPFAGFVPVARPRIQRRPAARKAVRGGWVVDFSNALWSVRRRQPTQSSRIQIYTMSALSSSYFVRERPFPRRVLAFPCPRLSLRERFLRSESCWSLSSPLVYSPLQKPPDLNPGSSVVTPFFLPPKCDLLVRSPVATTVFPTRPIPFVA